MKNLGTWIAFRAGRLAAGRHPRGVRPTTGQSGFVTVKGRHFELDGKPYYFAGTNLWYGMYLGSPGATGDRARLAKELDQLAAQGVRNLRVLAISEASTLKRAVTPAVMQQPDSVDETLWKGLDFLLEEMRKRDMRAVLYLNNFWQWSGGMSQYVAWFNGKPVVDPDVTGDWNAFMDNSAAFYREPRAQEAFRGVIRQLIGRKNSVNGRSYADDPTIMSWQLANEPRPGSDANARPHFDVFVKWVDETAGFIKSLAPKQLVSTGNEGWMGTRGLARSVRAVTRDEERRLPDLSHVGAELAVVQPEERRGHLRRRVEEDAGLSRLAHRRGQQDGQAHRARGVRHQPRRRARSTRPPPPCIATGSTARSSR